jgi:zinc transporter 1/2/3
MFAVSVGAISVPLFHDRFKNNNHWNSLANAFSGGVFLAIGMLHLLPEAAEALSAATSSKFPYSFLLAIASYTFVMYIEKVAFDSHKLMTHGDRHTDLGKHHHGHGHKENGKSKQRVNCDEEEDRIKHELNMRNRFTQHLKVGLGDRKG